MRPQPASRRLARTGTAVVEMAVVLPVFIALVFGMVEAARLGMAAQVLNTAAREGCRVAVLNQMTQADVQTRVNSVLSGSGISVGTVTPTPANWTTAPNGTAITVSLSVPYNQISWLPTPVFLNGATVSASATMSSERP